jgi:transposase
MEIKRPFTTAEWLHTPETVRLYIEMLEKSISQLSGSVTDLSGSITQLKDRTEKLEQQVGRNSQNSNQPPSADGPFKKPQRQNKKAKRKRGGQKGHTGHRQQLLEPTDTIEVKPEACGCGNRKFSRVEPFYTHQHIELPEIELEITHFVLYKGCCSRCGRSVSAKIEPAKRPGYGPRMSALVAELSGMQAVSRQAVQQFLSSVLGLPISTGAIQKIIDRVSRAAEPAYEQIGQVARQESVGYIDETSWFKAGKLHWLWVMATVNVALYLVHPRRSREAFNELIRQWQGILVSDNYRVYQKWVSQRQSCLSHHIRKARGLSESGNKEIAHFGQEMLCLLQQLCHFANAPPGPRKWKNFYSQFVLLLMLYETGENEAGKLARSLAAEMDSLWVFLDEHGVEPTNNRAERALRFGVLWRKRSLGSQSDKGLRWVERILSIKETCRIKAKAPFCVLVNLVDAYFKEQKPDLAWIG